MDMLDLKPDSWAGQKTPFDSWVGREIPFEPLDKNMNASIQNVFIDESFGWIERPGLCSN